MSGGLKYLWIAVEADEYELPIAVADSSTELGKMMGLDRSSVARAAARRREGTLKRDDYSVRYYRVEKEDE